jgi:hypothetical protein
MKKTYSKLLKLIGIAAIVPGLYFGSRQATIKINEYCDKKSSPIETKSHLNYLIKNEQAIQNIGTKTIKVLYFSENSQDYNIVPACVPESEKANSYYLLLDSTLQNNSSGEIIHEMNHIARGDCDKKHSRFVNETFLEPPVAFYTFKRVWKSNH